MAEGIDKLFMWEDMFGRDFTLEDPCGLYCSIADWAKWVGQIGYANNQTKLALADLEHTGSRAYPGLEQRYEAWEKSFAEEPKTLTELREHGSYNQNTKIALDRLVELGKQLRNILRDITAALKRAGAVSKVPGSNEPSSSGTGFGDIPWYVWAGVIYFGWREYKAGSNGA